MSPIAPTAAARIAMMGRQAVAGLVTSLGDAAVRPIAVGWATRLIGETRHPLLEFSDTSASAWIQCLARLTMDVIRAVASDASLGEHTHGDDAWVAVSDAAGRLWLDDALASHLDDLGDAGRQVANMMRERSARAWRDLRTIADRSPMAESLAPVFRLWGNDLIAVELVAECLVRDRLRPALRDRGVPTLPLGYARAALRSVLAPGQTLNWKASRSEAAEIFNASGRLVARAPACRPGGEAVAALERPAFLEAAGSMVAHRLLRFIAWRTRELTLLHELSRNAAAHRIVVQGGLTRLAELIGAGIKKTAEVEKALMLFQALQVIADDGSTIPPLLTWSRPETNAPGRSSELVIVTSDALLSSGSRRGKLVPVPQRLPPRVGSPNQRAGQAALQLLVLEELRQHGRELVDHDGVQIAKRRWRELADEARVSRRVLDQLLTHAWVRDDGSDRAFLCSRADDRWTLGPSHEAELEILREGGAYSASQSIRGKRGAAAKRARARSLL